MPEQARAFPADIEKPSASAPGSESGFIARPRFVDRRCLPGNHSSYQGVYISSYIVSRGISMASDFRRDKWIHVRVNALEKTEIERNAQRSRRRTGDYLRILGLGDLMVNAAGKMSIIKPAVHVSVSEQPPHTGRKDRASGE